MVHTTIYYTLSGKEAQPHFYAFARTVGVIELKPGKMFEDMANKFVSLLGVPASSGPAGCDRKGRNQPQKRVFFPIDAKF
ncbi:MAG: hypothetical protein RSJ41_04170 [Clostridia bacterium]